MSLAQFDVLLDRHLAGRRHEQLLAGSVAAAVYNANPFRSADAKTLTPVDFFPSLDSAPHETRPQTLEEQIAILTAVMGCGPGKPGKKI